MDCPICLAEPVSPIALACCKNVYCSKCIAEWSQVRNVCPLCCAVSGGEEVNLLKNGQGQGFDDGSLMLETEMKEILERVGQVEARVGNRRDQFKNYKCAVSASLMCYLQKQLERIQIYRSCMQEQHFLQNRSSTVEYMQLLTESILNIETSLLTNCAFQEEDEDDEDYDYEDEDEGFMDEYMEDYEMYEEYEEQVEKKMGERARARKGRAGGQGLGVGLGESGKMAKLA